MKLMVSQMVDGENSFHFESGKDDWVREVIRQVETQGYRVQSPFEVDLQVTKLEPDYYLRGKIGVTVQQPCARCAELFSIPVQHRFELAMAHVSPGKGRKATLAEESEELDINFFEGNEIDLVPVVAEQFVLSVPYRSLCQPDCRGICQQCGKNLNQGQCGCSEVNPVNPFADLKNMKRS